MNTQNKNIKTEAKKIILFQSEGQADAIVFLLDVPSNAPDEPNAEPFFLSFTQEGYGANWLKVAFGVQPDEVVNESYSEEILATLRKINSLVNPR